MPKSTVKTRKNPAQRKRTVAKPDLGWDDAIQEVLRDAEGPLHYGEIAEIILARGLKNSVGAAPAAVVATYLSNSLRDPDSSPYIRVGRGQYTLRTLINRDASTAHGGFGAEVTPDDAGALRSFGMLWRKDAVNWDSGSLLAGSKGEGATTVNFASQVGIYLLYDRDRVIYVGRASDTLFSRLKSHTRDRLASRWDRFSWFGLRAVNDDGGLSEPSVKWQHQIVIQTMEAVLIESLEPPLNRRRGDDLSAIEYFQVLDKEFEKKRIVDYISRSV